MILYPAIDLKDGQCVRLLRGEMSAATVFGDDPAAQALKFQDAGCTWLHLVDLNGAFAGAPVNGAAVEAMAFGRPDADQLAGSAVDLVVRTAQRTYRGTARIEVHVVDLRPAVLGESV